MLRFNSRALKAVLKDAAGNGHGLLLIRDRRIYLVAENGRLHHGRRVFQIPMNSGTGAYWPDDR
ncbi:hypothetical protein RX799_24775 [Klebsiella oxytoca]|uniref:hypothetical protein n=1 Tax=Klebsiella oxytoca TaxID=571 RepID=UPI00384C8556